MASKVDLPQFDDLPFMPGTEDRCAWGLFDKNGKKDIFGTLNLLTPEVIQSAYASELKLGQSVSLNWHLGGFRSKEHFRKAVDKKVISFFDMGGGMHAWDDEVSFNTQCSSQWDSLVHFHHQKLAVGYNGAKPTKELLGQDDPYWDLEQQSLPTLDHWHSRGGFVARGVLIDYARYAKEIGRDFDPLRNDLITIEDLETVAKKQGVEFRTGDLLIVRTGLTEALEALSGDEQTAKMGAGSAGVRGDTDMARWIWNSRFCAVAGDTTAFEVIPPIEGTINDLVIHQYCLAAFGMPIGELWDLKELSKTCEKLGRWSFLVTSVPLRVPGLVGSPPNALALF